MKTLPRRPRGRMLVLALAGSVALTCPSAFAQDEPTIGGPREEPAPGSADPAAGAVAAPARESAADSPDGGGPAASARLPRDRAYAAGVAAYESGDFALAHDLFEDLVARGHAEPTILMALGNSAYRQDHLVEAIYALEWARWLDPSDADVRANLEQARTHVIRDEVPSEGAAAALRLRETLRRIPTAWTAAGAAVLWLLGWLLLAARQRGRARAWTPVAVAALLLSLPLAAHVALRRHDARGPERGIVQSPQVEVRSGPGSSYASLFTLHAGTLVEAGEERAGWRRIELPQGPQGWVSGADLAIFGHLGSLRH